MSTDEQGLQQRLAASALSPTEPLVNTAASRKKRVLIICQASLETVAMLSRILNEISVLEGSEEVQLHVAWLLDWSYRRDPTSRRWAESVRSEWGCPQAIFYSLPLLGKGSIGRYASAAVRLVLLAAYLRSRRIEVVQVHSFYGVQGAVLRLKKFLGFRCVLDMQGAYPEEVAYLGGTNGTVENLHAREREALRDCDSILCVSQNMVRHLVQKHHAATEKFRVLPCCVPRANVGADPERRRLARERLKLDGKFVLAYAGGTGSWQCVPEICDLFARVAERWPEAALLVFSWGDLDLVRRCLNRFGIDPNLCVLKRLDQSEVHEYLVAGDVGLLLREDQLLNHVSSPTKFAEYLAAGLPVITTPHAGDAAEIVVRNGIGTVVDLPPATDVQALMSFLGRVRSSREELARKCLSYVEDQLVWEGRKAQLLDAVTCFPTR